jgi:integral membrane sensor domain MASE1
MSAFHGIRRLIQPETQLPQSALISPYELNQGIHPKVSFPIQHVLCVLLVCAGYFWGALIGQSLKFPDSHLSLIWPPTAILLAALLLAPPRLWWIFLLAVAPVHIVAQLKDDVPVLGVLSQLLGNDGQALLAAMSVRYFVKDRLQLDSFRTVIIFVLCAVI